MFSDKCWIMFLVGGMLLTGSINTLAKKVAYQTKSDGENWEKPWTCTLVMFTGEMLCLLIFAANQKSWSWFSCRKPVSSSGYSQMTDDDIKASVAGSGGSGVHPALTLRSGLVCILPAVCDVGGTTLSGIGLLFTTASVWQMLRGSIILFTGMLSVVFLKRKLERFHFIGMGITIVGITIVGFASIYSPMTPLVEDCCCTLNKSEVGVLGGDDGYGHCSRTDGAFIISPADEDYKVCSDDEGSKDSQLVVVGDILIIASQVMSGFQMVVEEKFLKGEGGSKLPSEFVVGMEGLFGATMLVAIFIPILRAVPKDWTGIYEDIPEGFRQLGDNSFLLAVVAAYW